MSFSQFTTQTPTEVLFKLATNESVGLSQAEALARLKKFGANLLADQATSWRRILLRQFRSAFIYLLLAAMVLAYFLGEQFDAFIILLFVAINTSLGFYQEYRSEQTVQLLKRYLVKRARVKRDGREQIVSSETLVPGDLIVVETGDIIPADIRFVAEQGLYVNESVISGESVAVKKNSAALESETQEIFKASNIGFSGTTVVEGKGEAVIFATGRSTELGQISSLVAETSRVSIFAKKIDGFSKFILRLVLVTLVFVFIANLFIKGLSNFTELLLFSVALAVSVIPEALPVVITFGLSRGAARLAKQKVVAKRLSAIEDLGGIEVLCTDKTGTLTENNLVIDEVNSIGDRSPIFFASLAAPFLTEKEKEPNNAFDLALQHRLSPEERERLDVCRLVEELPFDPERRRNSVLIEAADDLELVVRGAPEEITALCTNLTDKDRSRLRQWSVTAGHLGKRVIAVARRPIESDQNFSFILAERELEFVGLISFIDPLKSTTREAIDKAKELGVKVKILTGDSPEVAAWVAREVGLIESFDQVLTGERFDKLPATEQIAAAEQGAVFARVSPQQKFKIIKLLEEHNEVGFLGEGINDAPALKIANVGIVVDSAADIAREAADIILLNKSLKVIIDGIAEGRIVFANTIKYIKATLTSNFGNFFAVATASLILAFLPMLPLQILLVNLLSDFPMIAIATDNVDPEELKRPRSYKVKEIALFAVLLGVVSTVFDFIIFGKFYHAAPAVLQTNWFIGSILTELVLLFSIRTQFPFARAKRASNVLFTLTGAAAVATVFLPFTKFGQEIFRFVPPSGYHLLIIFSIVGVYFVTTETVKLLFYKTFAKRNSV